MPTRKTYANIKRAGEWCVNYVSKDYLDNFTATIQNKGAETDEIAASGFTAEASRAIQAPSIAESAVSLECKLVREIEIAPGSVWSLFIGDIAGIAIDEKVLATQPEQRVAAMGLPYNIRGTVNPLTGDYHGPNTYGLLGEIIHTV